MFLRFWGNVDELKLFQDKLALSKVGGPSKPYIDQNLQIHLPGDSPSSHPQQPQVHSPIYSHYVGSSPASPLSSQINENELIEAMAEAEQSYEAWKKLQKKIKEAVAS